MENVVISIYELQYQKNATTTVCNLALDESNIATPVKKWNEREYAKAYMKLLSNFER